MVSLQSAHLGLPFSIINAECGQVNHVRYACLLSVLSCIYRDTTILYILYCWRGLRVNRAWLSCYIEKVPRPRPKLGEVKQPKIVTDLRFRHKAMTRQKIIVVAFHYHSIYLVFRKVIFSIRLFREYQTHACYICHIVTDVLTGY